MTSRQFRAIRRELGYTQSAIAERFGVSRRTISGWEKGSIVIRPIVDLALQTLEAEQALARLEANTN